jgi:hypothetical protein
MKTEGKIWVIFDSVKNKKTKPLSVVQTQMMILTFKSRELHQYHLWTPGWAEWIPLSQYLASEQKYFVQAQPPEPAPQKAPPKDPNLLIRAVASSLKTEISENSTFTGTRRYTQLAPEEPRETIDYGYYYNEFRGDDLSLSGIPDKPALEIILSRKSLPDMRDRRISPRHDLKIEAILLTKKGTSFRSHSRNISLTGTLLEDEIPKDFFNRPFEMILVNKFEQDQRRNRVHLTGRIIGDLSDPKRLMFLHQNDDTNLKLKKLIEDYQVQQARNRQGAS